MIQETDLDFQSEAPAETSESHYGYAHVAEEVAATLRDAGIDPEIAGPSVITRNGIDYFAVHSPISPFGATRRRKTEHGEGPKYKAPAGKRGISIHRRSRTWPTTRPRPGSSRRGSSSTFRWSVSSRVSTSFPSA